MMCLLSVMYSYIIQVYRHSTEAVCCDKYHGQIILFIYYIGGGRKKNLSSGTLIKTTCKITEPALLAHDNYTDCAHPLPCTE